MQNDDSLTCMKMIDPVTGLFEIFEIPMFDLDEVTAGNDEYIDKSSARVSQMFNNTWLCKYPMHAKSCLETDMSLNETKGLRS